MTGDELYRALLVERFARPIPPPNRGGPDTDEACQARRDALVRALKGDKRRA